MSDAFASAADLPPGLSRGLQHSQVAYTGGAAILPGVDELMQSNGSSAGTSSLLNHSLSSQSSVSSKPPLRGPSSTYGHQVSYIEEDQVRHAMPCHANANAMPCHAM